MSNFIEVGPRDHTQGPEDAPVTLVEYGDFECPHCGRAYGIVKSVQGMLGDKLRFVFRHFPLTSAHPHAQRAAETAEWAAERGAFWPMYERLYQNQGVLDDKALLGHAKALGLDTDGLARTWSEHTFIPRIKEDFLGGLRIGVKGTPAFFINGVRHEGPWDFDDLRAAIEGAANAR